MNKLFLFAALLTCWGCAEDKYKKATVAFYPNTTATLREGGLPLTISLHFSTKIEVESQVLLSLSSLQDIETSPAADPFGKLLVPVAIGATSVDIIVTPKNNDIEQGNSKINFKIEEFNGDIRSKANDLFVLTFLDDDGPQTIADTRGLFPSTLPSTSRVNLDDESYSVRGVITSDRSTANLNTRAAHLQDGTAAIGLFFDQPCPYDLGDSIEIKGGDGAYLGKFNQFLQINLKVSQTKLIKSGVELKPRTITTSQLNDNTYEAELVRIDGCIFTGAGTATFISTNNNVTVVSPGGNFIMRTTSTATFANQILPIGVHSVIGLAGRFNATGQLILRDPARDLIKQ